MLALEIDSGNAKSESKIFVSRLSNVYGGAKLRILGDHQKGQASQCAFDLTCFGGLSELEVTSNLLFQHGRSPRESDCGSMRIF